MPTGYWSLTVQPQFDKQRATVQNWRHFAIPCRLSSLCCKQFILLRLMGYVWILIRLRLFKAVSSLLHFTPKGILSDALIQYWCGTLSPIYACLIRLTAETSIYQCLQQAHEATVLIVSYLLNLQLIRSVRSSRSHQIESRISMSSCGGYQTLSERLRKDVFRLINIHSDEFTGSI
jgi:hypothetical protein